MMRQDLFMTIASILFPQVVKIFKDPSCSNGLSWQYCIFCIIGLILATIASFSLYLNFIAITNIIQIILYNY